MTTESFTITITKEEGYDVPGAHSHAFTEWLSLYLRNTTDYDHEIKVTFLNDVHEDDHHIIFTIDDPWGSSAFTEQYWLGTNADGRVELFGSEVPEAAILTVFEEAN